MPRRLIAAAILVCCLAPTPALASGTDVIRDCQDNGVLNKTYTQKEYANALKNLPTDVDEYTDCRDQIKRARLGAGGGGGSGDSGNGSDSNAAGPTPASPAETDQAQRDVTAAKGQGGRNQRIANVDVRPGALAYHDFGSVSKLPTPLVVLGLLLVAATLGCGSYLVRILVRTRHGA